MITGFGKYTGYIYIILYYIIIIYDIYPLSLSIGSWTKGKWNSALFLQLLCKSKIIPKLRVYF